MHYYDFNIADYRKDTMYLVPIEHYIYRSLIDWYYLDESPIPNDTKLVLRKLSLGSENLGNLETVFNDFFELTENTETKESLWIHSRISRDIEKYKLNAQKNRENGAKGGRPKQNSEQDEEENPTETQWVNSGIPSESQINPNYKPITNNQELTTSNVIYISCAEPQETATKSPGKEPKKYSGCDGVGGIAENEVVITLPLNEKNKFHAVTTDDFLHYEELYPAVDVMQNLRNMRGWLEDNPSRRKTKTGIRKFIGGWLAKEQDKGGRNQKLFSQNPVPGRYKPTTEDIYAEF